MTDKILELAHKVGDYGIYYQDDERYIAFRFTENELIKFANLIRADENESLRNQLSLAKEQLAECQKDAERLNYLSNHDLTYRVLVQSQPSGNYVFDSCEVYKLREAIDQAMSEKG